MSVVLDRLGARAAHRGEGAADGAATSATVTWASGRTRRKPRSRPLWVELAALAVCGLLVFLLPKAPRPEESAG